MTQMGKICGDCDAHFRWNKANKKYHATVICSPISCVSKSGNDMVVTSDSDAIFKTFRKPMTTG